MSFTDNFGHPKGFLGRLMLTAMEREHLPMAKWAFTLLNIPQSGGTFAIINNYELRNTNDVAGIRNSEFGIPKDIFHFDFYRIKKLEEVYDMGYEDYFYSGALCFIEWPELIEEVLPDDAVRVHIEVQPDDSRLVFTE